MGGEGINSPEKEAPAPIAKEGKYTRRSVEAGSSSSTGKGRVIVKGISPRKNKDGPVGVPAPSIPKYDWAIPECGNRICSEIRAPEWRQENVSKRSDKIVRRYVGGLGGERFSVDIPPKKTPTLVPRGRTACWGASVELHGTRARSMNREGSGDKGKVRSAEE